jgi:hypothetical protein
VRDYTSDPQRPDFYKRYQVFEAGLRRIAAEYDYVR